METHSGSSVPGPIGVFESRIVVTPATEGSPSGAPTFNAELLAVADVVTGLRPPRAGGVAIPTQLRPRPVGRHPIWLSASK
jgi:hypothetical protein